MKEVISLNRLFKSGKIYLIDSFLTLRRWIVRDIETNNILNTKSIPSNGTHTGIRYLIPVENIDLFIKAFEDDVLYEKNKKSR